MDNGDVSLVIPGRNCASTIRPCLKGVTPLLNTKALREIIFVDDGSTDATPGIVAEFPVAFLTSHGRGPGAARNTGWQAAKQPLVWFVDADCVAEAGALDLLLPYFSDPKVAAVSGSYGIMNPDSLLACLVHEEIIERHRRMPKRVDFLATFNVVYRRRVLEEVGGFDERFLKGQDAELSWRVLAAGYGLRFEFRSQVKHYHPDRWMSYLRTQRQQGYWRAWLHLTHTGHAAGDSYSSWIDHVQPPLAMLATASSPLLLFERSWTVPAAFAALVALAQVPMTWRLVRRLRRSRYLAFAAMSTLRSFWRGAGMLYGLSAYFVSAARRTGPAAEQGRSGLDERT